MTDLERWVCSTFRRQGGEMLIGPIAHPHTIVREDVDKLIDALREIASKLPTLDMRLAGLSACEACDGEGVVHDVDRAAESDCPACEGRGMAPRTASVF